MGTDVHGPAVVRHKPRSAEFLVLEVWDPRFVVRCNQVKCVVLSVL